MERSMANSAMNLQPSGAKLCFDGFDLDEVDARLTCEGQSVPIQPRPFAVLCALARKPGHLVTKGDLLDEVWGHRFVTDSVLKSAISDVRAALQDDPRQPRYIETVSRRGYRFIVPLESTSALRRHADDDEGKPDRPTLAALTALCRGDAALADLIRTVAATLERDHPVLSDA
jgi:DNA-binding winged helix-turn-helix (wHTH) protein